MSISKKRRLQCPQRIKNRGNGWRQRVITRARCPSYGPRCAYCRPYSPPVFQPRRQPAYRINCNNVRTRRRSAVRKSRHCRRTRCAGDRHWKSTVTVISDVERDYDADDEQESSTEQYSTKPLLSAEVGNAAIGSVHGMNSSATTSTCMHETVCSRYYHRRCTPQVSSWHSDDSGDFNTDEERRMRPSEITLDLAGVMDLVTTSDDCGIGFESGSCESDGDDVHERNQFWADMIL